MKELIHPKNGVAFINNRVVWHLPEYCMICNKYTKEFSVWGDDGTEQALCHSCQLDFVNRVTWTRVGSRQIAKDMRAEIKGKKAEVKMRYEK